MPNFFPSTVALVYYCLVNCQCVIGKDGRVRPGHSGGGTTATSPEHVELPFVRDTFDDSSPLQAPWYGLGRARFASFSDVCLSLCWPDERPEE